MGHPSLSILGVTCFSFLQICFLFVTLFPHISNTFVWVLGQERATCNGARRTRKPVQKTENRWRANVKKNTKSIAVGGPKCGSITESISLHLSSSCSNALAAAWTKRFRLPRLRWLQDPHRWPAALILTPARTSPYLFRVLTFLQKPRATELLS
jgi:hypothetical protein